MAIDSREKRASVVGINFVSGPSPTPNVAQDQEWRQEVGYGYSGILAAEVVIPVSIQTFFSVDPDQRPAAGDVFCNNPMGDIWFGVLSAIDALDTDWNILHEALESTSWNIFPDLTPICLRHFWVNPINFNVSTRDAIVSPEDWETFCLKDNINFNIQLQQAILFTKQLAHVLREEDDC